MTISVVQKTLFVSAMEDCLDLKAYPRSDGPQLVLEQGSDTIWLDTAGARALMHFLDDWTAQGMSTETAKTA